jgi:outer membrane receptor protein involved in Fe transport
MPQSPIARTARRRAASLDCNMLMIARLLLAPGALLFVANGSGFAQTSPPESVLITARPPDPVGNAAFSTKLLDADQFQITPQLDQALRQVPALSIFRSNSSLSAEPLRIGVSLRSLIGGSGVGRALVTLDGVPQNDPFGQWVVPASLPVEGIQSVEIVRGAGAGPYGAGALTGVIEISERHDPGRFIDAEAGNLDQQRYVMFGNAQVGKAILGASGTFQKSGGWYLIDQAHRGAVDTPVGLEAMNLSGSAAAEVLDGTLLAVRFGAYDERRATGIVGVEADSRGLSGSATISHPETTSSPGWRTQIWFRDSDFSTNQVTIAPGRASVIPFADLYSTPALGWGGTAALRGAFTWLDWETGADVRLNQGEAHELVSYSAGAFQGSRFSGGRNLVGGIYAEAASRFDGFLATAGLRIDQWSDYGGHVLQRTLATGTVTGDDEFPANSGAVPTARGGIRKDFAGGFYARAAAYEGFRQPSLNELYRPTRTGNIFMDPNAALEPERLYGTEIGFGDVAGPISWNVTGFWNRLSGAIYNVTAGVGPGNFPDVGFLPVGGLFLQRQNVGFIEAFGSEGDVQWRIGKLLALRAAYSVTDGRVNGGTKLPQLTGKRPAQTARLSATGGIVVFPVPEVTIETDLIYQSKSFSDDLNTLPLPTATTFNATVTWHFVPQAGIYFAAQNIGNTHVAILETPDHIYSYDQLRALRVGITATIGP